MEGPGLQPQQSLLYHIFSELENLVSYCEKNLDLVVSVVDVLTKLTLLARKAENPVVISCFYYVSSSTSQGEDTLTSGYWVQVWTE